MIKILKSRFGIIRVLNFWSDSSEPIEINRIVYLKRNGEEFVNFDGTVYKVNRDDKGLFIDRNNPVKNVRL